MSLRSVCIACLALIAVSCARGQDSSKTPQPQRSRVERLLPLLDGYIFTYQNSGSPSGVEMFMVRVRRTSPSAAQLLAGSSIRMLTIGPDFVRRDGGGYLLREPLQPNASWQGDKGTVHVINDNAQVTVPAGSYSGCVQTAEEVGGDARGKITTWFCPDVGIARMQVEEWQGAEQLTQSTELRSFGPPMDLRK